MPIVPTRANPEPPRTPDAALRHSQIITLTMIIGLLLGSGVLGFMGLTTATGASSAPATTTPPPPPAANAAADLVDIFGIAVPILWALMVAVVVLVPGFMARSARNLWEARADDEAAIRRVYQGFSAMSILQAAALEGPGLFGAVATMLTGNWLFLLAPLGSVLMLAALFPRTSRINRWIEEATGTPPGAAPPSVTTADDEAA